MELHLVNLAVYNALLLPVIFFSALFLLFALASVRPSRVSSRISKALSRFPKVTVQIPVYNDPVAVRCIEKCLEFDYPKDRYEIVVADDSSDKVTAQILQKFIKNKRNVKLIRRENRNGYKAGALNNALKWSTGEIVVVFDADFVPEKDFLKRIVEPMVSNPKVAIVQSRMGYVNYDQNIVSRFAATLLMIFHNCILPLSSKAGTIFFCGTHGAIRKSALEKAGGWNGASLTEDADLSIKILGAGNKTVYLPDLVVAGELPFTVRGFLKQQKRWTYGTTRVFFDNWRKLLFSPKFSLKQKSMLLFLTLGNITTLLVAAAAISGQLGWLITPPKALAMEDLVNFGKIFLYTSGFIVLGTVALFREGLGRDFPKLLAAALVLGTILAFSNALAFLKAVFRRQAIWIKTPKAGNLTIFALMSKLFKIRLPLKLSA